jgi:hypothetical protein
VEKKHLEYIILHLVNGQENLNVPNVEAKALDGLISDKGILKLK